MLPNISISYKHTHARQIETLQNNFNTIIANIMILVEQFTTAVTAHECGNTGCAPATIVSTLRHFEFQLACDRATTHETHTWTLMLHAAVGYA